MWRNKGADSPRQIGTAPAVQTLKHYPQILRRIMKFAIREELIETLPLFPEIGRQKHTRAWFEPKDYELLKKVSKERKKSESEGCSVEPRISTSIHHIRCWLWLSCWGDDEFET